MNIKDVEGLAQLARIELDEAEKTDLLGDMQGILEYVRTIERVETSTFPGSSAETRAETQTEDLGNYNVWRDDREDDREFLEDGITEQFPDSQDGFLKVKKIL